MAHLSVPAPPSGTVPDPRVIVDWHVTFAQYVSIALAHGKASKDAKSFYNDDESLRFACIEIVVDGQPVTVYGHLTSGRPADSAPVVNVTVDGRVAA